MSKIVDYKAKVWESLPKSEKQRSRDICVDIIKEHGGVIDEVRELGVTFHFPFDHPEVRKIIKKTRGKEAQIKSLTELTIKEKILVDKKEKIFFERWKTKAQYKVIMSLYKQAQDKGIQVE